MTKGEIFLISETISSKVIGEYIKKHYPGYGNRWSMSGKRIGYGYVVHHEMKQVMYCTPGEIQRYLNKSYKISDDFLFQENLERILE